MKLKYLLAAAICMSPVAAQSATTLLTSNAGYTGPGLNLSAFANGNYNFTFGPITVDQYTFTAAPGGGGNSGQGSVVGQGGYGLGANGSFGGNAVYIGVDSGTGYAQLVLNGGPVRQLGFFFNYAPGVGDAPTISALDQAGNVFASYDLAALAPISTPNGMNQFAFRGISDSTASIYGLRFGGSYILAAGSANGLAAAPAVPEPATWAMMLIGFGAVGYSMRSRKAGYKTLQAI